MKIPLLINPTMRSLVSRLLIFAPVALLSFFSPTAHAEPIQGLLAIGYSVDNIPPTRSDNAYPTCGSEIENNINRNFDYEPFQQCPDDYFMVHYTGGITIPAHDTIEFWLAADDGGTINIGGNEFGTWDDKGCSASESGNLQLEAGSHALNLWMYENGGNTCLMLAWNIDNQGWAIVPDDAFTTEIVPTTTSTSTSTTSTTSSTTTTSTTIVVVPTTQIDQTTTTSTLVIEQPVTTEPMQETTTTEPEAETTTTIQETTTTISSTTTQLPEPTEVEVGTTLPNDTTVDTETITTDVPDTTDVPKTADIPETTDVPVDDAISLPTVDTSEVPTDTELATMTSDELETAVDSLLANADTPEELTAVLTELLNNDLTDEQFETVLDTVFAEPLSNEDFSAAVDALLESTLSEEQFTALVDVLESDDTPTEQVIEAVTQILENGVSETQATELATSEKVLESVSGEQATVIFEELPINDLTTEEAVALVSAAQNAPESVKNAFEETVNVFGGVVDTYIPLGSKISISARRLLIVTTAMSIMLAPAVILGKNSL